MLSASGAGIHLAREQILSGRLLDKPKHSYHVRYRGLCLAAIILFRPFAPLVLGDFRGDFDDLLK